MKKYVLKPLVFAAIIFNGSFADTDGAANAAYPGSGASFDEDESEHGSTLSFTDANGQTAIANVGDALKAEVAEDGTFKGWTLVSAAEVAENWQEAEVAAPAPAPAAAATAVNAGDGAGGQEQAAQ